MFVFFFFQDFALNLMLMGELFTSIIQHHVAMKNFRVVLKHINPPKPTNVRRLIFQNLCFLFEFKMSFFNGLLSFTNNLINVYM